MKRIFILFLGFILIAFSLSACDLLSDDGCAECCLVTYDADYNEVSRESCVEYCDDELTDIENQSPVTIGNNTTEYECL